jgi:hypothetical protein
MTTLNGKQVTPSGARYEELRMGKPTGRMWTMVQEKGCTWWKPAFLDELREVPSDD